MTTSYSKPEKHVFVCRNERRRNHPRGSCGESGGDLVFFEFAHQAGSEGCITGLLSHPVAALAPARAGPMSSYIQMAHCTLGFARATLASSSKATSSQEKSLSA